MKSDELTVFSEAVRMPAEERAAFLEKVCEGDAVLRRRVEELLASALQAGAFMETPAADLLEGPGNARAAAVPAEKPGDRIGRYELVEQIGEGGCGIVYRAAQEEPVRRSVALKVIKLGMDTRSVIARFEAERQALALMDHPDIARVLDAGATSGGRPYFVMELVEGVKITDFCDRNRLSIRERLELFARVCMAIQHAHQKGIIHRDIKPSNILVTAREGGAAPKVIDFGIAKATHGRLTDETLFTAFEQFIGTPAYMSPEQADGKSVDVDTRSDIYSLGVLLYELLTGVTPFDARKLAEGGLDEIRRAITEEEPARPSARLGAMTRDELSKAAANRRTDSPHLLHLVRGDLDWIVMKALEKDRARRYETANGLAADIRRHLDNEPVIARPPSNLYRFQKLARRNRVVFAAAAAIALALAAAAGISFRESRKAQAQAAKSREVARFLEDMLKGVGPSVAMGSDTTLLRKILDNTAQRIGADLGGQPEVEAELRYTLGEVYWEVGDLEKAEEMHRRALAIRRTVFGERSAQVAQSMGRLSHVLWRRGQLAEAERMSRQGIALQRELFGSRSLEVARSVEDLAAILNTRNRPIDAEAALREAVGTKEALLGSVNLELADSLDDLAWWLFSRRYRRDEAEALARRAIDIREKLLGADNLLARTARLKLEAQEFDLEGKSGEQEATLFKLVEAQRQLFGGEHPSVAQTLNTLASVLRNEGKLAESEPVRREALSIQRKLLGEQSAEVAQTLSNLGELLVAEGRLDEAEQMHHRALTVRTRILGDNGVATSDSLIDLGRVLEAAGKFKEARELYRSRAGGSSATASAAQRCLGQLYLSGKGVGKNEAEGAKLIRKSAESGNSLAQIDYAVLCFEGRGVARNEAEALARFHQAEEKHTLILLHTQDEATKSFHKTVEPVNVVAMKTLAECYCGAGRADEALALMRQVAEEQPRDADALLTLATWEQWFGRRNGYEITCRKFGELAQGTKDALLAESAAKAFCLGPTTNVALVRKALELAKLGVELRKGTRWLPWYELSLGLAQFRNGDFASAEATLDAAAREAGTYGDIVTTARMFRAMSLYRLGRGGEAQSEFEHGAAQMPAYPGDPAKPTSNGKTATRDVMIGWLAYREAKSEMNPIEKVRRGAVEQTADSMRTPE